MGAPPATAPVATIYFANGSVEIIGAGRAELTRVANILKGMRHIEVHAYAGGNDPADDRKLALARALVIRSYLIDLGVTPKMEVANSSLPFRGDGTTEYVDILAGDKTFGSPDGRAPPLPIASPDASSTRVPQVVEQPKQIDPSKAFEPPAGPAGRTQAQPALASADARMSMSSPSDAALPPTPRAKVVASPPAAAPVATIYFANGSVEIAGAGRAELARAANILKGMRHIELHAYAGGNDPTDDRKLALARALMIRSYLIDLGVTPKMEVANSSLPFRGDGTTEYVDILGSSR